MKDRKVNALTISDAQLLQALRQDIAALRRDLRSRGLSDATLQADEYYRQRAKAISERAHK